LPLRAPPRMKISLPILFLPKMRCMFHVNQDFRSTSLFHVTLSVAKGLYPLKLEILRFATNDTECHFA
jgi:hypothetical protein